MTIALGSGRATGTAIAPKAALLDRAAAAGLPVPAGWIVEDGTPADRFPAPPGPCAVRSAFGAEDGDGASLAGWFDTHLHVAPGDVAARIGDVRASGDRHPGRFRRDVLVMAMVDARHAGVAFTEPDHLVDVVNVTEGLADRLVRGDVPGRRVELHRFDDARPVGDWAERLRGLLDAVRRTFGPGPDRRGWDIEFADDGRTCWLVQIRPVTAPLRRVETLTVANHREILPDLPSTFMTSLIGSCSDDLWSWWSERSPEIPRRRPFVVVRGGRPFINLSLLEDTLELLGLPPHLVAQGFGGSAARHRRADPARLARHLPVVARLGLGQIAAVAANRRRCRRITGLASGPHHSWQDAVATAQRAYVSLVTGMMPLSSAAAPGTAVLARLGVLHRHAARHRTVTTEMAELLREGRMTELLARFGHRGVYESDLARPRWAEQHPEPVGTGRAERPAGRRRRPVSWRDRLLTVATLPVWWPTRAAVAAREAWRDAAMHAFADVRRTLLRLADEAVARGALPARDDVWLLRVDEVLGLDRGRTFGPAELDARRAERDRLAAVVVPDLVTSDQDAEDWETAAREEGSGGPTAGTVGGLFAGIGLTEGVVEGTALVLREPSADIPPGSVVVAPAVDAGWMGVFHRAAAVAVETGGDLSHGSILLRELGVPAVTNIGRTAGRIATGDRLLLDARRGTVRVVARAADRAA